MAQEHEDELRQQHAVQLGTMEAALKEAAALDTKSRYVGSCHRRYQQARG